MDTFNLSFVYKKHEKKHKSKPMQFTSVASGVQKRFQNNLKHRKSSRLSVFDNLRNLSRDASPAPAVKEVDEMKLKQEHRRQQLERWKLEKEKKKKEEAVYKKKPFVASVAHAPLKYVPPPPIKTMPSTSGRVTRSQAAKNTTQQKTDTKTQSFAPKNAPFRPPQLNNAPALNLQTKPKNNKKINLITFDPKPAVVEKVRTRKQTNRETAKNNASTKNVEVTALSKTKARDNAKSKSAQINIAKKPVVNITESSVDSITKESKSDNSIDKLSKRVTRKAQTKAIYTQPDSKNQKKNIQNPAEVTPKNTVPKSESGSEEKLRSPRELFTTPERVQEKTVKISPCVTFSRGKDNARREMKKKLEEGLLESTESVQHFRLQLTAEVDRMSSLCRDWEELYENCPLPEAAQEQVLGAVGQARLLMRSKLQQFSTLVDQCSANPARVTPQDLQGFWDMVFIQIVNIDVRFRKLDELRRNDWCVDAPPAAPAAPAPPAPAPAPACPARRPRAPRATSRLKDVIAAARRAKKEQIPTPVADSKTFEAGFFSVVSPVRSPLSPRSPRSPRSSHTPRTPSMLKAVLSNEAKKASVSARRNSSSSYAMLHASLIGKNIEIEGVEPLELTPRPLPQIDLNATPARSILKCNRRSTIKPGKKSIKVVLFDSSMTEPSPEDILAPQKVTPENGDSGMSSMDVDHDDKENARRRSKLVRQEALDGSPVMTRSRRKSMETPKEVRKTPKRSRQKKTLQDIEPQQDTPKRTSRRKKNAAEVDVVKTTPKRSSRRNKLSEDLIDLGTPTV